MPARVVLVLDEPELAEKTALALQAAGYDAVPLPDSMAALDVLEDAHTLELLITCAACGDGKPNGIALARMARLKRPGMKTIFVGTPAMLPAFAGLGEFILRPVNVDDLVGAATRLLESGETDTAAGPRPVEPPLKATRRFGT